MAKKCINARFVCLHPFNTVYNRQFTYGLMSCSLVGKPCTVLNETWVNTRASLSMLVGSQRNRYAVIYRFSSCAVTSAVNYEHEQHWVNMQNKRNRLNIIFVNAWHSLKDVWEGKTQMLLVGARDCRLDHKKENFTAVFINLRVDTMPRRLSEPGGSVDLESML